MSSIIFFEIWNNVFDYNLKRYKRKMDVEKYLI